MEQKTIGFIGAGKVGYSLGRYLKEHHMDVSGYYSANPDSAKDAAEFTQTECFKDLETIVRKSEILFLTVPDGKIKEVWDQLKQQSINGKIVCHCSGALSTDIFSDIDRYQVYGYSIHPLFAINDRYHSYKELSNCLFTIEGHEQYQAYFQEMFASMGNQIQIIPKEAKVRYHAAAAMASNLVVALAYLCQKELAACGFSEENARHALSPILLSNMQHIVEDGCVGALTGPLERCDVATVKRHLEVLQGNDKIVYQSLSKELLEVAKKKNKERNYEKMEELFS